MTTHRPSVVVPFKPAADAGTAVDSADTIAKRADATLADLERRLARVEALAKPSPATWR